MWLAVTKLLQNEQAYFLAYPLYLTFKVTSFMYKMKTVPTDP